MSATNNLYRLEPWLNPPKWAPLILECLERADRPMVLREIMAEAGVPRGQCANTLSRLHAKGLVERWKVPMTEPHAITGGTRTRMMNLYTLPKDAAE